MTTFADLMTEDELKEQIITYAQLHGWRIHHDRPARRKDGSWETAIEGHKGFPDLVLARGGVVIFAELKSEKGKASRAQKAWLSELGISLGQAMERQVHLWRPSDLPQIKELLT